MKTVKHLLVVMVIFWTLGLNGWGQDIGTSKDDFGKISGQIIDPETSEPVKEIFNVSLFEVNPKGNGSPYWYSFDSDSTGRFIFKIFPRDYYIAILPTSESSKYCSDILKRKTDNSETSQIVKIEKGKITKVIKKATIGGSVRILLVDQNNQPINIKETFKKEKINPIKLLSELDKKVQDSILTTTNELLFNKLFPGPYSIKFAINPDDTDTVFWGKSKVDGILVEKGKTTTVNYPIFINTGLEGRIVVNSVAQFEIIGYLSKHDRTENEIDIDVPFFPNQNGDYKILNLNEGYYDIELIINNDIGKSKNTYFKNILVNTGIINIKNFTIDFPAQ